jgi:hypothetical protein
MTPPITDTKAAARARGQALRLERTARARRIRRRVVSGAVVLFVAAWLFIAIALVSGHDPALASKASTGSTATTGASTPSTSTSTSRASSASTSAGTGVSSVTTSQS